jgi:hypothetical protein
MIVGLVSRGLATMAQEKMKVGGKLVEVARVPITDAGHAALGWLAASKLPLLELPWMGVHRTLCRGLRFIDAGIAALVGQSVTQRN